MEGNWKKKLVSMFLVLALCLSMVPTSALAEEAAGENQENGIALFSTGDPVEYVSGVKSYDENGIPKEYEKKTVTNYTELTNDESELSLTSGWYVVKKPVEYRNLKISGKVNLILCDGGLDISDSINLADESVLNVYGSEDFNIGIRINSLSNCLFTCTDADGTAKVCIYGVELHVECENSKGEILQPGVSLSGAPQMERRFRDADGEVISDWENLSTRRVHAEKCGHRSEKTYVPSTVSGHDATVHQQKCPDCGLILFGENPEGEKTHEWADGKCSVCNYECKHTDVDASGLCTACKTQFEAKVVASDGTTTYYAKGDNEHGNLQNGLYFAINAAPDGSTIYPLRSQSVQAWLEGTGRTLTLNMNGITLNGSIYVARGSQENQTLILTGEGCIDDTIFVHEHGTLQTKDLQGTVGKLWIYSGAKVELNGGTYGQILRNSDSCIAGSILKAGYAFQKEDGSFVRYNTEITNSNTLNNVTVVKCSAHQDEDNDKLCDYCNTNISSAAAKVTTAQGETYYFMAEQDASGVQTVDAAVASATDTVTLLTDHLRINNANCTIDLNGKRGITITASGSDLVVTDSGTNGTVALLDTTSGSAKLKGGTYNEISTGSNTLGSLLPDGYGFQKTGSSWLTEEELAISGSNVLSSIDTVTVTKAPFESLSLDAPESITYTEDLTVTANLTLANNTSEVTYKWYEDGRALTGQTAATLTLKDTKRTDNYKNPEPAEYGNAGDHTFKCVASSDGYVVSKEVTVTVNKADLSNARLTISGEDGLAYDPVSSQKDSGIVRRIAFDLWYNDKYLTVLPSDVFSEPIDADDYTVTGNKGVIDAGIYTLTVTGQGNYTGTKSIQFVVKPCELSEKAAISNLTKEYDGTTDLPLKQLDFVGFLYEGRNNTIDFYRDVDYTVEGAQFENADVGNQKTVIIKFRMLNPNYSFAGGQREIQIHRSQQNAGSATQEIVKAAAADQSVDLEVMNGHAKTYTVDLSELIPELTAPKRYGDITYGQPSVQLDTGYYAAGGAKVENGVLSLPIKQVDTKAEGEIGTVKVVVSTTNYKDMTLTVNVKATNKLIPTGAPTLSKAALTYGEKLGDITLSGSMNYENATVEGTFAWVTPDAKPDATSAYAAEWIFTPTDGATYAEVSGKTEIAVNKATPSGEPVYTKITAAGKTVTAAALAVNPNWPAGTVKWVDADGNTLDDSTEAKANTAYQWLFTPTDTNNYNTITGTIVLYTVSSSGGGSTGGGASGGGGAIGGGGTTGGGASAITVPVSSGHGDTTISATVEGTTATIAADGEQIDKVIADGAKSVEIDISGLGDVDTVKLPTDIISKADDAKGTTLTIKLADGVVELSQKALKTIASGEDVTISIRQTTLTDAQRQSVGSLAQVAAVVDVNLYVGEKQQSRFGGGALTISIPYTPKAGEDTSKLAVWFIRDDGTIENKNGTYDAESGCFVFKTRHLSRYLLVDTTQARIATDTSAKIGVWTQVVMFFREFLGK